MHSFFILITFALFSIGLSAQTNIDIDKFIKERDSLVMLNIGKSYPNFELTTLDGETVTQKDLIGKVTWINFWFQYCAPCIAEFEELNIIYGRLKENSSFQFLSFTTDSKEDALKVINKYRLPFKVCIIDQCKVSNLNYKNGFPTNIIIDKEGNTVLIKSGGSIKNEDIKKELKTIEYLVIELLKK